MSLFVFIFFVFGIWFPLSIAPSWLGRAAQTEEGSGLALFERSEFSRTPLGSSTAGCPKRSVGTQTAGRLSFAYFSLVTFFWRSKRKLLAAGPLPASRPKKRKEEDEKEERAQPEQDPATA